VKTAPKPDRCRHFSVEPGAKNIASVMLLPPGEQGAGG
jgi:hypothetical protein